MVEHLVLKCLSQVRLGVLLNLSLGTCTLKKSSGPAIYPIRAHPSRSVISLWLKALRIHCRKLKKKKKISMVAAFVNLLFFFLNWDG